MLLRICFFLNFYFLLNNIYGQSFLNFRFDPALPFSKMNCIKIDKSNVKWMGTENGLFAFSGDTLSNLNSWRKYDNPNSSDSLITKVTALAIDSRNHKWVACYGFKIIVVELDEKGNYLRHLKLPKVDGKSQYISGLAVDKAGKIWVGTQETGVWMLDKENSWHHYTAADREELRSNNVVSMAIDDSDMIWVGTDKGLCSVNDEMYWEFYDVNEYVSSIAVDKNLQVCLGLIDRKNRQHLYCNNESFQEMEQDSRKKKFTFNDLIIDNEGIVWMAGNGLGKYENGVRTLYTSENSTFTTLEATSLALDQDGNLWVGTISEGLYKYVIHETKKTQRTVIKTEILLAKTANFTLPKIVNTLKMKYLEVPIPNIKPEEEEIKIVFAKVEPLKAKINFAINIPKRKLTKLPVPEAIPYEFDLINEEDIVEGTTIELENLSFKPKSFELLNTTGVESLLSFMKKYPKIRIELAGHTDMEPEKTDRNYDDLSQKLLDLSKKRVESVSTYLINKGIPANRIEIKAYGGTKPLVQILDSPKNRRVEMKILKAN
ncbi:MAG: hypothetical protein EAZ97_05300 [Bacteroidetes bacterium]|nr:MAG: hypothetical protein EAZ97_05300 [Bacteroidota bacterium]